MGLFLLAAGCVPAAVYGLRFDGGMPEATELSAVGGVFPGFAGAAMPLADTAVVGFQGRQRLSEGVAVALAGGVAAGSLEGNPVGVVEIEVQGRVLDEAPVTLSLLGGVDGYGQVGNEGGLIGVHAGLVVSRHVGGDVRPYLAAKVNPILNVGDEVFPWVQYGGGLSWRPELTPAARGLLALEASGYRGFGANLSDREDLVMWGMMLQVGASFGNRSALSARSGADRPDARIARADCRAAR